MSSLYLTILFALQLQPTSKASPVEAMYRAAVVHVACEAQGVPGIVGVSVAYQESRFDPDAENASGARGLMQVMSGRACAWFSRPLRALGWAAARGTVVNALEGCYRLATWKSSESWRRRYLCHYASGVTCKPKGALYEREVKARIVRFLQRVKGDA